ncbi:SPOR domain-containing protein [Phaeovulum sp. NW3]|uniref:SPOR domain-containing protein n=1 Tax=Phaeovulum sp. NW3 TaxID=2934933 RepID=UPI00202219EF|nr:SPOR domain-containing protein [Phaeovulum sp. NW3]MCL7465395.1 SPOR domain-containing protein [Phaeovulum sp. NW3]
MASIHYRDSGSWRHEQATDPAPMMSEGMRGEGIRGVVAPVSRWVHYAGALTSVALVAGLGVWGYKLAVRDLAGVPVIRAMDGPARIAPDDPGGDLARHVGLSVNAVAAHGTAAPAPDQVVLAPQPGALMPDDAPMATLVPPSAPVASEVAEASPETMTTAAMPVPDSLAIPAPGANAQGFSAEAAAAQALADSLAQAAEPAAEDDPEAGADLTATETAALPAIPDSVPGVARSPRPQARPARDMIAEAAARAVAEAMAEPAALDVDPDSLPAGTRLVQLGAFDAPGDARGEWDRVADRFASLMAGKRRVIQEASSGGRTFYRLRVEGFADVADARRFCAALLAEQVNCIPAQVR